MMRDNGEHNTFQVAEKTLERLGYCSFVQQGPRFEYPSCRFPNRGCNELGGGRVFAIKTCRPEPDGPATCRASGLDVGWCVAHHPGLLEVDPVLIGSLQQHPGPGLPTFAISISVMRTIINRVDGRVFPLKMMKHSLMNGLQNIHRQFVSGYGALIRHDDQQKAIPLEISKRPAHSREKLHLLPRGDVLTFWGFANEDSVTIEKYSPAQALLPFTHESFHLSTQKHDNYRGAEFPSTLQVCSPLKSNAKPVGIPPSLLRASATRCLCSKRQ